MAKELRLATHAAQPVVAMNKDVTKLATGASILLTGRMAGRALGIISQIALARLLGPGAFGLYAIGWTVLRLVEQIAPLGLHNGVIHFGSRDEHKRHLHSRSVLPQALGLALLAGFLIGVCLYFAAPWLAEQVFRKPDLTLVLRWIALACPLMAGFTVAAGATQASQRMQFTAYGEVTLAATNLMLVVLLGYWLGWKLLGAVVAIVVAVGIAFGLVLYYTKRLFPEAFSIPLQWAPINRELMIFSLPTALIGLINLLNFQLDRLFIGYYRPAAEVGIYQSAALFLMLFPLIISAFSSIVTPLFADLYHRREMERLEELFRISTKWGLYVSLPMFLVIFFAPQEMISVTFGDNYASGAFLLVVLAIGQLVNVGAGPVGFLLIMTGRQKRWLVVSITMLIVNISLNLLLVPRVGLIGSALAVIGAMTVKLVIGLVQARRSLGMWPYDRRYLKGALAMALAVCASYLLRSLTVGLNSPVLMLLLVAIVSTSAFVIALLLLGLNAEDRELIRLTHRGLEVVKEKL